MIKRRRPRSKYKQLIKELVYMGPQGMHADYCLRVAGDIPREGMKDGDIIFLEKSQELRHGKLAYIELDGKAELKRVYVGGGDEVTLQSLGDYTQIIKTELQNIRIIGYATYILKQL